MVHRRCNAEDSTGCIVIIIVMLCSLIFGLMLGCIIGVAHERSQAIEHSAGYYIYPNGKPIFIYGVRK